jgi:hypothetical protein
MKRIAIAVCVVVLAVAGWAQKTAPKPDPEIKKFDVFLGHWAYTAEYKAGPLGPASKVTGELFGRKILGGFFFEMQAVERGATGETRAIEIVGYDPANKAFFSTEYHDNGNMFSGTYVFNGNTVIDAGKFTVGGKAYIFKATMILAADSMSFVGMGEISTDGNSWTPWLEIKYTKVPKPASTK